MSFRIAIALVICIALAVFALYRIWSGYDSKREGPGVYIFWSVISVFLPFFGPVFALAFARIPPLHGEDIEPGTGARSSRDMGP
ncbi:MAG: hypothetical protein ACAH80_02105 [Alphaproteobacteria bacterium]